MAESNTYDLIIIGAGSAGVRCARTAAGLGAKVAIIESRYMGGTCVNVGCIPKKLFVYASQYGAVAEEAAGFGWTFESPSFDWTRLRISKNQEIERLNQIYEGLLEKAGVEVLYGQGRLLSPHTIDVEGRIFRGKYIVIASGGWPRKGDYPGAELAITSNEVFSLEALPQRVLIEGGGYIALEFAGIFNGLGCATELAYRGPLFLRDFDQGMREFLAEQMRDRGVELRFTSEIASIQRQDDGSLLVRYQDGGTTETDLVFSAIGRRALVDELGLENTQASLSEDGFVQVDENFRTAEPSVFALGDVIGRVPLTPVALKEGMALAHYLFSGKAINMDYENIPTAIFCQPECAVVGLSEEQARQRHEQIEVYTSTFKPLRHTLTGAGEKCFMKLVVDKRSQVVLGCHIVGEHAAEIMQGIAVAVRLKATKQQFDETVGIHPSAAEELVTMR